MGFLEDMMGNIGQANQGLSRNITQGLSDFGNSMGQYGKSMDQGIGTPGTNGSSPSDPYSNYGMGSADSGPMQSTGSSTPTNTGSAPFNWQAGQQSLTPMTPDPPSQSQAFIDAFMNAVKTPAMRQDYVQQAFDNLKNIQPVNYLKNTQDAYKSMLDQLQSGQDQVHGRYDQVGTDMRDLYNTNANVSKLGNNNILQQVAQAQGKTIQDNAQGNVKALADLKNAELAQRAAIAQKAGTAQAAGDYQISDPSASVVSGTLQNAQQGASNALAQATQNTNLNNQMANAINTQGIAADSQLQNQRTNYDQSLNKYRADMANQEATREMEAQKQMYADQMARAQAGYGISKDQATMDIEKFKALVGNKGFMSALPDIGSYNLDQSKAMAQGMNPGNIPPDQSAMAAYPQFQQEYLKAIQNGMGLPAGTKPTANDFMHYGMNDTSFGGNPSDWAKFAQMATAQKAMSDPMGDFYSMMQNSMG